MPDSHLQQYQFASREQKYTLEQFRCNLEENYVV